MTETVEEMTCEHQKDYKGKRCLSGGFEFGPMKPARGDFPAHRMGDLWAGQQLGVRRSLFSSESAECLPRFDP
jgi:hypothetical protein